MDERIVVRRSAPGRAPRLALRPGRVTAWLPEGSALTARVLALATAAQAWCRAHQAGWQTGRVFEVAGQLVVSLAPVRRLPPGERRQLRPLQFMER